MTKAEAEAWVNEAELEEGEVKVRRPWDIRNSLYHTTDRTPWPPISFCKRRHLTFDNLLVEEKIIQIKMPWKKIFWIPENDNLQKERPVFVIAWYKIPCSKSGYRIRIGMA